MLIQYLYQKSGEEKKTEFRFISLQFLFFSLVKPIRSLLHSVFFYLIFFDNRFILTFVGVGKKHTHSMSMIRDLKKCIVYIFLKLIKFSISFN